MERIGFVAVGPVAGDLVQGVADGACKILGAQAAADEQAISIPDSGRESPRQQVLARAILDRLRPLVGGRAARVLGITEADLYARGLNFVFGQADAAARVAVISLARLRPESCGLEANRAVLLRRAVKEAVHELGHTFGLSHCARPSCVMHFSNTLAETDQKREEPCEDCRARLAALAP